MPLLAALVVKEFQTWIRSRFTFALFGTVVLGLSVLFFLLGLMVMAPDANAAPALLTGAPTGASGTGGGGGGNGSASVNNLLITQRPLFLFGAVGLCLLLVSGVLAPAVAASAFSIERERGTLDLLLLQTPGTGRVVLGKLLASFFFSVLVLLIGVPLFVPAWSFGGVHDDHVLVAATVILTATFLFSSIGLFFGALVRSALTAAILAQAVVLLLLVGTFGIHVATVAFGGGDVFKPILWLNPFLALLSGGGTATDSFARLAPQVYRGAISLPVSTWIPGVVLPAWIVSSAVWILLGSALLFTASVVIDPCHPLKTRGRQREHGVLAASA